MPDASISVPQSLQELPPKWAHFCLHVEKFITDDLGVDPAGKTIVTAFSGGIDSTALLLVLQCLARKNDGRVIAVHMNHGLRPDAAADAVWAKGVCRDLGVECIVESTDINQLAAQDAVGIEEAGRIARYKFFERVRSDLDADFIAVGHHLDDLCEDVVMRLVRGTAWPGLAGMAGHDKERSLIRPFLLTPKSQLIEFLTDIGVEWREDSTNEDESLTRNRIRRSILPLLAEENPSFGDSVARLWKVGRLDREYWHRECSDASDALSNELLSDSHQAKRLRLYKAALDALGPGQALADTLFKLDKAWSEQRTGTTFQFPGDKTATIAPSGVVFAFKH